MKKHIHIVLPLIVALSFYIGFQVALFVSGHSKQTHLHAKPSNKIAALLELIETEYADSISIDELTEDIIPLILEKLDPHSSYIVPEDYNDVKDPIMGSFEGIGVQFNIQNDTIIIVQVISGGPSEMVKIQAGDRIIKINDSIVAGKGITNNKVMKLLKGPKGTKVKVGILRRGNPKIIDFVITRDKIPYHSIDASYMIDSNTGYIKISRFAVTTPEEFTEHMKKLKNLGMTKIIVDLRENGGGVLNAAIALANEFLEKGDLIVYTQGKSYKRQNSYANGKGAYRNIEIAVLINEFSASASEIFAGAIQDNDRGIIIGRRSFGKGFVNRDFMFADSSMVRLTIQKFYSPSGRCIQKPYDKGAEEYANDILNRYLHGEFKSLDSINFPDSLKYKTKKGRTVYGGGGIMPEYFVPMDTVAFSTYYSNLINKGILYDFAFDFADKHRDIIKKNGTKKENMQYFENVQLVQKLISYASTKGLAYNAKDFALSQELIQTRLYAFVLRNVFDEHIFYQIVNTNDATIQKAYTVLQAQQK